MIVPSSAEPNHHHHHHRQSSRLNNVVSSCESTPSRKIHRGIPTPTLSPDSASMNGGGGGVGMHRYYNEPPSYSYHQGHHSGDSSSSYNGYGGGDGDYSPEIDAGVMYGSPHEPYMSNGVKPRRWACDYCNVATFLSFEECSAHEEVCSRRHHHHQQQQQQDHYNYSSPRFPSRPPLRTFGGNTNTMGVNGGVGSGLGALYHASQELVGPTPPPGGGRSMWNSPTGMAGATGGAPPIPVLPTEKYLMQPPPPGYGDYYHHRGYEMDDYQPYPPPHSSQAHQYQQQYQNKQQYHPQYQYQHKYQHQYQHQYHAQYQHPHHHQKHQQHEDENHHHNEHHHRHHDGGVAAAEEEPRRRMLLALESDAESLSDRQCYVRTTMVEIFGATEKDVTSRHTKGAQKLVIGQVGIRCVHCANLRTRDRAERAICYPSSISRIYQTVADMQRFHFEHCKAITDDIRKVYKTLKTTRPRGVGSPQTYWVQSAKVLGLADTEDGIRFEVDLQQEQQQQDTLLPTSSSAAVTEGISSSANNN